MNLLAYADGSASTFEIAEKIRLPMWELDQTVQKLKEAGILRTVEYT